MGIIQGIIFGLVVLLNKKYSSKTNSFLSYTVFSLSLSNLQYWITDINLSKEYIFLDWLRIPSEFLMIPMFFFFVNSYLEKEVSKKMKMILILPFILDFLLQIIVTFNTVFFNNKLIQRKFISKYFLVEEIFSLGFSTFLILLTLTIVNNYEKENTEFKIENVKAKTKWIKNILLIGLLACFLWITIVFIKDKSNTEFSIYYPIWISISFIIYWLSYIGLFQSNIYSERIEIRKESIVDKLMVEDVKKPKKFNTESYEIILEKFENLISELYINPNLSLDDIAKELNISSNYLSQIINSNNIKFNDYLNLVRIEKVQTMLKDNSYSKYTITSIGLEAGFNSNASFYRAFKKHTKISPLDYRNSN